MTYSLWHIQSLIHAFTHSLIHAFTHSLFHSFTHSSKHSSLIRFTYSFTVTYLLWHIYCDISNRAVSNSYVKIWNILYDISKFVSALARFNFTLSPKHAFTHQFTVTYLLWHIQSHCIKFSCKNMIYALWHIQACSCTRTFQIHSITQPYLQSFTHCDIIHSFTHSLIHSFTQTFFTHEFTVTYLLWHIQSYCIQFSCSLEKMYMTYS